MIDNHLNLSPRVGLFLAVFIVLVVAIYRKALPKVIPGLPHNASSAHKVLGDLPNLLKSLSKVPEATVFFALECQRLQSPIIQIFLAPFAPPMVVLVDYREIQDVLLRRHAEFDRAETTMDLFRNVVPHGTISLPTGEQWKMQRRIWQPTMGTEFLREVAAPRIHDRCLDLVQLWRHKAEIAKGRPFNVSHDFRYTTMDIIWQIAVGNQKDGLNSLKSQLDSLARLNNGSSGSSAVGPQELDTPVSISLPAPPETFTLFEKLLTSVDDIVVSPFPKLSGWITRRRPWYRRAWNLRERLLDQALAECRERFAGQVNSRYPAAVTSAMDLVLQRESVHLQKEKRKAEPTDRLVKDELFTFLLGGWETTATTLLWLVTLLSNNQDKQFALRASLLSAFPMASLNNLPSAREIISADLPYVDATIAEALRVARTAGATVRMTTQDTILLGHAIPKGTPIILPFVAETYILSSPSSPSSSSSSSLTSPAPIPQIPESVRSPTSRSAGEKFHPWPNQEKKAFNPDRWLRREAVAAAIDPNTDAGRTSPQQPRLVFDDKAGPSMPFSIGPRACFGTKLAKLELKIIAVLLCLSFQLEELPEPLREPKAHELLLRKPTEVFVKLTTLV